MKKLLLLTSCIFLLMVSQASALMVNAWEYELEYYFSSYTIGNNPAQVGTPATTTLTWGYSYNGNPSSMSVVGYSGTDLITNNGPVDATQITHNNFVIYPDPVTKKEEYLKEATIKAVLTLTPFDPAGFAIAPAFSREFDFSFYETPNAYPAGDIRNEDIFLLKDITNTVETFVYSGYEYTFMFTPEGGAFLQIPAANAALLVAKGYPQTLLDGNQIGYIGFTTPENASTSKVFELTIAGRQVPEPATMVLFGIGLLGLAGVSRKKIE